jgi:hypothetical protein
VDDATFSTPDTHDHDNIHFMPCSTTVPDITLCMVQDQKTEKSCLKIAPNIIFVCILGHGDGGRFAVFCKSHVTGAISEVEFGPKIDQTSIKSD